MCGCDIIHKGIMCGEEGCTCHDEEQYVSLNISFPKMTVTQAESINQALAKLVGIISYNVHVDKAVSDGKEE